MAKAMTVEMDLSDAVFCLKSSGFTSAVVDGGLHVTSKLGDVVIIEPAGKLFQAVQSSGFALPAMPVKLSVLVDILKDEAYESNVNG